MTPMFGVAVGNDTRMRVFICATRAAILRKVLRMLSKVARRHWDFFGAASLTRSISQYAAVCRISLNWLASQRWHEVGSDFR